MYVQNKPDPANMIAMEGTKNLEAKTLNANKTQYQQIMNAFRNS